MAYLDRWKTIFPEVVGSEARPDAPIDNTLALNTDGFPQFIANDPVGYALQNAFLMQLFSNDARLGELIDNLDDDFTAHLTDVDAHSKGIAGNAASATKLKTARDIKVNLESESAASFDGTNAVNPGVDGVLPVDHGGTGATSLSAVTVGKANQLTTARTIDGVDFNGTAAISHFGVSDTAAATAAKTVACAGFKLVTGAEIVVRFKNTNSADSPTLNVNGTGAKGIHYRQAAINKGYLVNTRMFRFVYDGVNYQMIGDIDTNTTYSNMTAASADAAGKAGLVPAPAAGKQASFLRGDGTWVVPTNTDTHYTTHLYAGSGAAADAATTNGNTKLTVVDNTAVRDSITIKGTGATTVTSDANGVVTIHSTDNNTTYSNFVKSGSGAKAGLVPAPSTTAGTTKYLREDGSWQVPPNTTYSNFVKSGSGAKAGLVPAPSTTAGTTKYLREDGSWQVPPDTNTDTHWTSHLYVGDGTAANKATTNGNTKIVNTDNSSVRNAVTIKGTGATTVTSDANGVITIHSTDNNTTYSNMTAATASAAGKAGLVPAPAAGKQGQFLRGDGTWQTPTNTTYSAGTTAQLTTGTDTANRVWPAKQIADYVKGTTSLAQNGYWKAPNGLIIQWGTYDTKSSGSSVTVSFPVSFPAACSVVNITEMDDSLSGAVSYSAAIGKDSITKQNFVVSHDTAYKIHWIALGN